MSQASSEGNRLKLGCLELAYIRPSADGSSEDAVLDALVEFTQHRKWIYPKQVHGKNIVEVNASTEPNMVADGMICSDLSCGLAVFGGDCPGLVIKTNSDYFGIAHCGWRGTAAGIVNELVLALKKVCDSQVRRWEAYVGPGISGDNYEVDEAVSEVFDWKDSSISWRKGNKIGLDLKSEISVQLVDLGFLKPNIKVSKCCTYASAKWHSYRRDGKGQNQLLAVYRV